MTVFEEKVHVHCEAPLKLNNRLQLQVVAFSSETASSVSESKVRIAFAPVENITADRNCGGGGSVSPLPTTMGTKGASYINASSPSISNPIKYVT